MALGPILERFWAQVGGQVGAQIDPKSIKKAMKNQMYFVIDFLIDLGGVKQKQLLVFLGSEPPRADWLRPLSTSNRP